MLKLLPMRKKSQINRSFFLFENNYKIHNDHIESVAHLKGSPGDMYIYKKQQLLNVPTEDTGGLQSVIFGICH